MTTPNELYSRPHEGLGNLHDLAGFNYSHIPELALQGELWGLTSTRVVVRLLKEFDFDYRRVWRLATVWFDDKPVMVIQNSGREGDDFARRFVTDVELYTQMLHHIRSLLPIEVNLSSDVVGADAEVPGLTQFANHKLDGYFKRY